MDSNFSVSTIFGIWESKSDLTGKTPRELVAAALAVYGSRSNMILYNTQNKRIEQLTLLRMGRRERWIVTAPDLKINPDAKLFSPALKASYDTPNYLKVFFDYCKKGTSIRYSGAYAVDCS